MRVRLDQVQEHPVSWDERISFDAADLGQDEVLSIGPVHARGELSKAEGIVGEGGFLLRCRLEYPLSLSCFRCLAPHDLEVDDDFELLILSDRAPDPPSDLELEEADLDVLHVDEEVDLEPLILEQLRLNVPMKPLCSEDCRGLCSRCGADLNAGPCQCPEPSKDERWAGLSALRDRLAASEKDRS